MSCSPEEMKTMREESERALRAIEELALRSYLEQKQRELEALQEDVRREIAALRD